MNQGLYGPFMFVPYYDEEKEEQEKDERESADLYSPEENMFKGNIFKNEYIPFEKHLIFVANPKKEDEKLLQKIQEYSLAAHDLRLYLDVHPCDKKIFEKFAMYASKANELIDEYESKYGVIRSTSAKWENNKTSYNVTPSVWVK
ncbi:MAG: spore coat protein CotJB [Bacilli bacterium]